MDSGVTTGLLLALVALSDGLRMLPAGALVLNQGLAGSWSVWSAPASRRALRLVTWCPALAVPLILESRALAAERSGGALASRVAAFRARAARARWHLRILRALGLATLAFLVAGLPALVMRAGAWGFVTAVAVVVALSALQAVVAATALRRLGWTRPAAALASLRYCWPFTAPRAPEDVQRAVVGDLPPLVAAHALLPADDFARLARPMVYDALVRGASDADVSEFVSYAGDAGTREITGRPPARADGSAYCPRCGDAFNAGPLRCPDCVDVTLIPMGAA